MRKAILTAAAASTLAATAACGASDDTDADTPDPTTPSALGPFADGTYEATGTYSNPAGQSDVTVEVTLKDEVITAVTVTPGAENATSKQYQNKFAGGIADKVVGKRIDELDVNKVAGSSLTHAGFNLAIEEIKADASA